MSFEDFMLIVAHELVWREAFFDTYRNLGINYVEWPLCLARSTVDKYLLNRDSNGHLYAQNKVLFESEKIADLLKGVGRPKMVEEVLAPLYAECIKGYRLRELAQAILENPSHGEELISGYENRRYNLTKTISFADALADFVPEYDRRLIEKSILIKIPKYPLLSSMIGGFNPGRIGILLADTGYGKTNLGIALALSASEVGVALYFNMEMISYDFTERLVVSLSEITFQDLHSGRLNRKTLESRAFNRRLFMTDGKDLSLQQIKSFCRAQKLKTGLSFCVIDYDQKLILETDRNTQEWKALQNAVIALESLAKELGVYILILAQQNEEGAISGSRRATFSASTVLKFYNDEGIGDVVVAAKNRFGKRNAAIKVNYSPDKASILEEDRVVVLPKARGLK